jgi:AraC family transcriptional regulator, transcriptional activator of pobA
MAGQKPFNFEYHKYLQKILGADQTDSSFFIASEKDFAKGDNIDYPYRSYFYVVGLMHQGDCKIKIGITDYEIKAKTLSLVGPGIVRQWTKNDWKATNHTIFFKADFFQQPFYNNFLIDYPFFKAGANHCLNLIETDYSKVCELIHLMKTHSENKKALQGLFFSYLEFISKIYSVVSKGINNSTRTQNLSNQFSQLLHNHYQEEKEVTFYANKLNLSSKNLSEILKNETGHSAKQKIDEFIIFEAKSLLKQTQMSIKEIVYWLGYEDPSYFTKLFKSKEGITPLEYRNK